jgi:DNA-binding NtrC family response regulator
MSNVKLPLLLVDDEPMILESLKQLFEREYHVYTATSAEDALTKAAQISEVALVISDHQMPGITGVDLLKEIRERYPESMRILLTGYSDLEAVLESVNSGQVFRYVRKPWQPETLKSILALAAASYILKRQKRSRMEAELPKLRAAIEPTYQPTHQPTHQSEQEKPLTLPALTTANPSATSFEEEFLASFSAEHPAETTQALQAEEREKRYHSFEEEFFAELNRHAGKSDTGKGDEETPHLPDEADGLFAEEESGSVFFDRIFLGKSGKPKVLVVGDDRQILSSLAYILDDEYDCIVCSSLMTALDILELGSFVAVVISDQNITKQNGLEFLHESLSLSPVVPRVLMSGYMNDEDVFELVNEGSVYRHLQKPWTAARLRQALSQSWHECRERVIKRIAETTHA